MGNKRRSNNGIQGASLTKKVFYPKTDKQERAFNSRKNLVMSGSAGTGKTFVCLNLALEDLFNGVYQKIIIVRSIVPTRDIGFLPGTLAEKCSVYEAPYKQIVIELFGRGDAYEILKQKGIIEFVPTSFIRGVTLDNTVVIVDESQNMTLHELDSIATRLGKNCRFMVCGDYRQADLPNNGFKTFLKILEYTNSFDMIEFTTEDIVRSGFVRRYIEARNELNL